MAFEAKEASLLHDDKEHDQGFVLINERPSALGVGGVMLPEALKEGKEQIDIVGEEPAPGLNGGRPDPSSASWKMLWVFPEED